jgi:phosphomevalonate kinase
MIVTASAPGKLVLTGEYAVLEGAPALVMAIDRRARVALRDADAGYGFDAPELGISGARCRFDRAGRLQWADGAEGRRLGLVTAALEAVAVAGIPAPFRAELDTHGFFAASVRSSAGSATGSYNASTTFAPCRIKLGLGSSAALLVALAGAVCAHEGRSAPSAAALIAAHRGLQHGRGSGLDIAASLTGGLLRYRLREDGLRNSVARDIVPEIASLRWPGQLAFCCVWSGRSASTSKLLQQMAAWRAREPGRHASAMAELGACAAAAAAAAGAGDARALLRAVSASAGQLARLGEASGVDIVCAEHRRIGAIAAQCGVVYKSCGAGGGDIGVALTLEPERLQALRRRLATAGFHVVDMALEAHGLLMKA